MYEETTFQEKPFQKTLIERAGSDRRHIVLPEGNDERILRAADEILKKDFAELTILGNPENMREQAERLGLGAFHKANLLDHKQSPLLEVYARQFLELRRAKGITPEEALTQMGDRNSFGVMMVRDKKAHGMVSGADGTTADTIRPALSVIKTRPGSSIASSVFLMCLPDGRVWVFGDCAVNPNTSPAQLAEIAILSAQTAASKMPNSPVAGKATVMIFLGIKYEEGFMAMGTLTMSMAGVYWRSLCYCRRYRHCSGRRFQFGTPVSQIPGETP
jgi:phosphotransacetylase